MSSCYDLMKQRPHVSRIIVEICKNFNITLSLYFIHKTYF